MRPEVINLSFFILSTLDLSFSYPFFMESLGWCRPDFARAVLCLCCRSVAFLVYVGTCVYVRVSARVCVARCYTVQYRLWCLYRELLLSSKGCPQPPLTQSPNRKSQRRRATPNNSHTQFSSAQTPFIFLENEKQLFRGL